jgi:hypothetical protein
MDITYDATKNAKNIAKHGLSFDAAASLDFQTAVIWIDDREDYGETRYIPAGLIEGRLHILVFIETPQGIRVISLRKANKHEVRNYEKDQ